VQVALLLGLSLPPHLGARAGIVLQNPKVTTVNADPRSLHSKLTASQPARVCSMRGHVARARLSTAGDVRTYRFRVGS